MAGSIASAMSTGRESAGSGEPGPSGAPPAQSGRGSLTLLLTTNRRRGAEVQSERLAEGLRLLGWSVEVVALTADRGTGLVAALPVSKRLPDQLGRLNLDVVAGLRRHLRSRRPDVVVANGSATLRYGLAAMAAWRGRPHLAYVSIGDPAYWARGRRQRLLYRWLLRRPDLVIAVSEMTRDQLLAAFGLPRSRVQVAHTGVPRSFLDVEPHPGEGALRLLFVGSLTPEKGPIAALQVLADLRRSTPSRLRLVGGGPLASGVEERARLLGLSDDIELVGPVQDVRPHLAWADVLVLTSTTEGLPGVVLEAGAAGIPAVAFDVGGTREAIIDGISGRLIPPGDVAGFVEALRVLAEDEELRRRYGSEARQRIRRDFLIEHSVRRYHHLLVELRASRPSAAPAP